MSSTWTVGWLVLWAQSSTNTTRISRQLLFVEPSQGKQNRDDLQKCLETTWMTTLSSPNRYHTRWKQQLLTKQPFLLPCETSWQDTKIIATVDYTYLWTPSQICQFSYLCNEMFWWIMLCVCVCVLSEWQEEWLRQCWRAGGMCTFQNWYVRHLYSYFRCYIKIKPG